MRPYALSGTIIKEELRDDESQQEKCMRHGRILYLLLAVVTLPAVAGTALNAENVVPKFWQYHQVPDKDGVYYVGPEVSEPKLVKTVYALYPSGVPAKDIEGMTVMAMVIDAKGIPTHIELLHPHGQYFDQGAIEAVRQSAFEPGKLNGKPVPVWIDVRVVYWADRRKTTPQVMIAERDLPAPPDDKFLDKNGKLKSATTPMLIHIVDADYVNPFVKHPMVEVARVTMVVGVNGDPKEVRVVRGLAFGTDEKAKAAVEHYHFIPATKHGVPVEARADVTVPFVRF
jgi:TonB family protein